MLEHSVERAVERTIERVLEPILTRILKELLKMADQTFPALLAAINDGTNAVAQRVLALQASLANVATSDQLAEMQSIADHLNAIGTNPANPVPTPAPAAPTDGSAPVTPA